MRIRFWGTRGSIAKPGPTTVRYGGNTSCVEVRSDDGTLLVLDCGTGAHALGFELMKGPKPVRGHLVIGHTHWDHIQGLPFFTPLYVPGNEWDIYAPAGLATELERTLGEQMTYEYFPVSMQQLGATIRFHELVEGTITIGGIRVTAQYLNHPALTLGYRLTADGATLVYATDHEPHVRDLACGLGDGPGGHLAPLTDASERRHAAFLAGADLLVHDSQYTAEEYPAKVGWGHSTHEYVLDMARAAGVRQLALFHHDPLRTDDDLDRLVDASRRRMAELGAPLDVFAAAEGQVVELSPRHGEEAGSVVPELAVPAEATSRHRPEIVIATADAELRKLLVDGTGPGRVRTRTCEDGEALVHAVATTRPALAIVDARLPGLDRVNLPSDDAEAALPVMLIASPEGPRTCVGELGVTEWLLLPFSPQYLRTRVDASLLRHRCRWTRPPMGQEETRRLQDVAMVRGAGPGLHAELERLARIAARAFRADVAAVNVIDADRQWTLAATTPTTPDPIPRDVAICAHTILGQVPLAIEDAPHDSRFGDNPLFAQWQLRAYLGMPVRGPGGFAVGTICVSTVDPRRFEDQDLALIEDLATSVEEAIARHTALTPQRV